MNPIGDFFIEFSSKGFADIKEQLGELQKSLDSLNTKLKGTSKQSDSFIGGFKKWIKAIGVVWALNKALKETFQVSQEIRGLYKSADMLGVDPETLEKWTLVARLHGGNQGDATSFFSGLNEMSRNLREGKYSQELVERMARYGFNEQYLYNASLPENRDKLIGDINRLLNRKDLDAADVQALQSVFPGLNDTMVSILKSLPKDLAAELAWAGRNRVLSNDPEALKDATRLEKSKIELSNAYKEAFKPLQEPLSRLIDALKPLAQPLAALVKALAELVVALMPFVQWVVKWIGGSVSYVADAVSSVLNWIRGDSDALNQFENKYSKPGTGGALGAGVRTFDLGTEYLGNALGNAIAPKGTTVTIDLDSLPTGPTSNAINSMNQATVNGVLNASIEVLNNGVPAQDRGDGVYTDGRTGAPVGRVAWATSVQ